MSKEQSQDQYADSQERDEILAELAHYPQKRGACIEALKIVQQHRRWVSDESLAEIAELLDMSRDELDNVATFYNLIFRQPVGKHVILLCNSVSCWIMGYEQIRARCTAIWGSTLARARQMGSSRFCPFSVWAHATMRRP